MPGDLIIPKLWGQERVLRNDKLYCMKELTLKRGFQSSLHWHRQKTETFLVVDGQVEFELAEVKLILKKGAHVTLEPGQRHRFRALSWTAIVIEASTFHDDADVVRVEESRPAADSPFAKPEGL